MTYRHCLLVLPLVLLGAPSQAEEIKTIAGKSLTGTLEKITPANITLKTASGSVATPLAQVLDLILRPSKTLPIGEKYIEVQLLDESVLRCTKVVFGAKEAELHLTTGISVKAPLSAFASLLRDAQDDAVKMQWDRLQKTKSRRDRIFISRMGELNPVEGVLGEIDAAKQTIKFNVEGAGAIEPDLEKLQGIQFARTDVSFEPSLCRVIDVDGNMLIASKVGYDAGTANLTTPFGRTVAVPGARIARFDFNFGRLTYLSDLDAKMPEAPLLGGFNPVRKDANLDGNAIMLKDKQYPKGLSMYAGAELEYNLGGKYKEFKALLGVDSRIAEEGQGKVTVTIYCDREKRLTKEVSPQSAEPIAFSVKDVGTLRIVVSGSNFTNYSGHATLANAHVSQ